MTLDRSRRQRNHRSFRSAIVALALPVMLVGGLIEPAGAAVRTIWVTPFGMRDGTFAAAVASVGTSVYVAGGGRGGFRDDPFPGLFPAFVRKYDTAGNLVWSREFTQGRSSANDVAADATGVYVAGAQVCDAHQCGVGFVRKYDASGALLWSRTVGSGTHDVSVEGLALSGGAVYLAGTTSGAFPGQSITGDEAAFVMKLGLDGSKRWVREFGGAQWGYADDVASSRRGIYVSGATMNEAERTGTFVRRYASDGTLRWSRIVDTGEYGTRLGVRGRSIFVSGLRFAGGSRLARLDTRRGAVSWAVRAGSYIRTLSPFRGGVLASGRSLRDFDGDGTMQWSFRSDAVGTGSGLTGLDVAGRAAYASGYGHVTGDRIQDDDAWVTRLQLPAA